MKICTKCRKEHPETVEFWLKNPMGQSGFRSICKKCFAVRNKEYRIKKANRYKPMPHIYRECTKCKISYPATDKYWFKSSLGKHGLRSICKKCFTKESNRLGETPEYKEKAIAYRKRHYAANKVQYSIRYKKYYQENIKRMRERARLYAKANPEKMRAADNKRREDPQYRLGQNISSCIRQSLTTYSGKNGAHWEDLVGYTRQDLIKHLENKFKDGMSWENYGDWHLDHVTPKSVFNFTSYKHEDFKRCWALDNLQPLWAFDNISKSNKLEKPFQPSLAI